MICIVSRGNCIVAALVLICLSRIENKACTIYLNNNKHNNNNNRQIDRKIDRHR